MDGIDGTFRANFSIDGAAKLRERVRDKLKEFMGDYTDDTLVSHFAFQKDSALKGYLKNHLCFAEGKTLRDHSGHLP